MVESCCRGQGAGHGGAVVPGYRAATAGGRCGVVAGQGQLDRLELIHRRRGKTVAGKRSTNQFAVLTFAVTPQVDLPLEGLLAETAREGLVAGVFAHVRNQVRALAEGF